MGLIGKQEFICLDCESTGLDPKTDRMIEIAVVRFTFDEILSSRETLVNPECLIPAASQEIHHISQEMIASKPLIKDVLPEFLKMVEGHTIVGHGIGFDIALIAAEAQRAQIPTKILQNPTIDTLRMARLYGESPVNSLDRLRQHFNIEAQGIHRAMSDVMVNIEVFKSLAQGYKTTEQLFQILQKPIKLRTMPLGKHKGRKFDEMPLEYLQWAERKDFDQDLLYSIRCELRNRKKGGGSASSNNPFANL